MLSSNKPKMPSLYRMRDDLTWDDMVHNWKAQISTPPYGNHVSLK